MSRQLICVIAAVAAIPVLQLQAYAQESSEQPADFQKQINALVDKADPANDDWLTERLQSAATKQLKELGKVLQQRDWSKADLAPFITADARSRPLRPADLKQESLAGDIRVVRVDAAAQAGAKDESLASRGPLPPPGFLSACLKLITQRQTARARQLLEPVVADHPAWAKAHFYLGLTYHLEKRYERAAEWFKRSLQLDPLYHTPRVFYGWCLYYLGDPDVSREMFESFLRAKPNYPDAIYALGLIDFDADDIESARVRFEKVIELAQKQRNARTEAKARARLADVLIRTNKVKEAKEQLDKSIELNPNNYEPYYKLSRVLERLGDHEAAERARHKHDEVRDRMLKTARRDQGRVNE